MGPLNQKTFIVTGASEGIGRAVTRVLADRGAQVIAVARSKERLKTLASEFPANVTPVSADLSLSTGIDSVVDSIDGVTSLSGVVHAAGSLVPLEPYRELDANELVRHFQIHVAAPIALARAVSSVRRIERMLFVDSYSANAARDGWAAYSIVKAAAQMSSRCAAQELDETVTIRVFPGAVKTRIVDAVLASKSETARAFAAMLERGECVEPEQAALFIVGLVADAPNALLKTREAWDYNSPDDRSSLRVIAGC